MNQEILRAKMRASLAQGKPAAALEAFHQFAEMHGMELIEPETAALASEALEFRISPAPSSAPAKLAPARHTSAFAVIAAAVFAILGAGMFARNSRTPEPALLGDPPMDSSQLMQIADKSYHSGDYRTALEYSRSAASAYQASGNAFTTAGAYCLEGQAREALGDLEGAQTRYAAARDLYKALPGKALQTARAEELLGEVELRLKQPAEGKQALTDALDIRKQSGDGPGVIECQRDLADLAIAENNLSEAAKLLNEARVSAEALMKPDMVAAIDGQRGTLLLKQNRPQEAYSVLTGSLNYWKGKNHPRWVATTEIKLSRACKALGRLQEAQTLKQEAIQRYRALGDARTADSLQADSE